MTHPTNPRLRAANALAALGAWGLALSACSGDGLPLGSAAAQPRVALSACQNLGGNFAVPFDEARALLPDGFEPLPTTGGPNAGAVFFVTAVQCPAGTLDGRALGPVQLFYAELPVVPAPEFAVEGQNDNVAPVLFTATPGELADAFADNHFGLGGRGDITWTETPDGTTTAQLVLGEAMVTLTGNVPPEPASAFDGGAFYLYGTEARAVVTKIRGTFGTVQSVRGPVSLQSSGAPAPFSSANPANRGFANTGFDFGFELQ